MAPLMFRLFIVSTLAGIVAAATGCLAGPAAAYVAWAACLFTGCYAMERATASEDKP